MVPQGRAVRDRRIRESAGAGVAVIGARGRNLSTDAESLDARVARKSSAQLRWAQIVESWPARQLRQFHSGGGFELGDRLRTTLDLDGSHAHRARGLQVAAEVVEIDARGGRHAELLAHHHIDTRI